jgi:hypothetical protein
VVDPGSIVYNKLAGAVNLVTFIYDGVAFRVTLTSYTDVEKAPYFVADYNLGAGVIVITTNHINVPAYRFNPEMQLDEDASFQVSAFDALTSVHYLGDRPLTYSIMVPHSDPAEWISSNDPKEAKIEVGAYSLGRFDTLLKVTDGVLTSNTCVVQGIFLDPNS